MCYKNGNLSEFNFDSKILVFLQLVNFRKIFSNKNTANLELLVDLIL